ncbi:MFS transporter [Sansalvadorimonas sp. 2012CJ34-2]|uniref:MFS transporter n=1 Tax=Parendozoicomonas callyspongiae TaxID=2942213 RepID=A0ABT0PHL7_9GAMM|nr:MFS transporter [Sansalvadorimonas sp. 2012CJ34-2]MCL6270854.1 MFS transporter [Sansalvadorimonas sp. 2012CJ34-2]
MFTIGSPDVPPGYSHSQLKTYSRLRLQVLLGIFFCYAAYYLVRKDFVLVLPDLVSQGFSKSELGQVMAIMAIIYGISNFVMGFLADRVTVRWLMPGCLILSALISLGLAGATYMHCPFFLIAILMGMNGWVQGAGWPSSAKIIAHWFQRQERGRATGFWNLSNNLGAGILGPLAIVAVTISSVWQTKLLLPAVIAIIAAVTCIFWLRDKPEDTGLPALSDSSHGEKPIVCEEGEPKEKNTFKGFCKDCLTMPQLWVLAMVNVCIYFIRYGVIDWVPLYMTEARHFSFEVASWAFFAFEFAAIPGTLLCGFVSDRIFRGRRVPVNLLYMSLVLLALLGYWHCDADDHWFMPVLMLVLIGFLIYGCVAISHVHMIDVAPRRYVAACVGFCGLFGYMLGASGSNLLLGAVIDSRGWEGAFQMITGSGVLALALLLLLWYLDNNKPGPVTEPADSMDRENSLSKNMA